MTWGDYLYINKCECPYCGWEKRIQDMEWIDGVGYVCSERIHWNDGCIECVNDEED